MIERLLSDGKTRMRFTDGTPSTVEVAMFHEEFPDGRYPYLRRFIDLHWNQRWPDSYMWNEWTETMQEEFCRNDFIIVAGSGASWKTTSAAIYVLSRYYGSPHDTVVILTSTTRDGLRRRIWKEITRYYNMDPCIGHLVQSRDCIQNKKGSDEAGIFGIALDKGEVDKAIGKIIGFHSTNVVVCVDEMPYTSEAIVEACVNLQSGCERFTFIGLGNPDDKLDPHGRASEPVNGWDSITPESTIWKTRRGICIHLDGTQSPNVRAGRVLYPGLTNQNDLENTIRDYGEDSPQYWQMRRGFWAPEGISRTVLSSALITKFHAADKVVWNTDYRLGAGLDPAYEGGDRCILRIGKCGIDDRGKTVLALDRRILIKVVVSPDDPLHYQIVRKVKETCIAEGIPPGMLAIDSTGEGGGLLSIFHREWSPEVMGVEFGGRAEPDTPVSVTNRKPCSEEYYNMVTQLWYQFRTLVMNEQIRGLDPDTATEFCQRRVIQKGALTQVEPKALMKERTKKSPDDADAVVVLTHLFMKRMNDFAHSDAPYNPDRRFREWREKMSIDVEDELYATSNLD